MLRFFLFWCFIAPAFAALPAVTMAYGKDVLNSETENEELFATFSLIGDSTKTPFILRIAFENCNELRNVYGNALSFTALNLKYYKTANAQNKWETINLNLRRKGKDCVHNIEFYNDVQETYNMEIWASWNNSRAPGGTFYGRASFSILPKP